MKTALSPRELAEYRAAPQIAMTNLRVCKGQCKKRRSVGQFDGDSAVCKTCVRQGRV